MNFNKYCKECGTQIEFEYEKDTTYCPTCNKDIHRKDAIAGYTMEARIGQLKTMHKLMMYANDESIYMTWIYRMPDCPSEEDFKDIALDDEEYNACFNLFVKLISKDGNRY